MNHSSVFSKIAYVSLCLLPFFCADKAIAYDMITTEVVSGNNHNIWGVDLESDTRTLLSTRVLDNYTATESFVSPKTGELFLNAGPSSSNLVYEIYDWKSDTWRQLDAESVTKSVNTYALPAASADRSSGVIELGESEAIVEIGTDANPTTINSEGVSVGGSNLIKRSGDTVSIGENSLKLREQGGRQQMWATDANGDSIDIDVTNGSRLLISGRDVEKSIDNVGALSAALGSVPAISADSQFTCGFGAGTHSSAYALSGGCASRVSDRVSVNAALATVINNHTGDSDDNLSARAGFTFRLGKIDDSPKIAARKAAELHDKVAKLEERNESLLAVLQAQASRLERLEKIASGQLSLLGDRASSD